ncbi:MAG: neocarzinostatin apoprotein domain-containing protein [Acidimicrobiales bacterium]
MHVRTFGNKLVVGLVLTMALLLELMAPALAQTGPAITIDPAEGAASGSEVSVLVSGFPPGETIAIGQCPTEAAEAGNVFGCNLGTAFGVVAGADGTADGQLEVVRYLNHGGTWIDCATPGECVVGAATLDSGYNVVETDYTPLTVLDDGTTGPVTLELTDVEVGRYSIAGRVTCSAPTDVYVYGSVNQWGTNENASHSGATGLACDGATSFEMLLPDRYGRMAAGQVNFNVSVWADNNGFSTYEDSSGTATVPRERRLTRTLVETTDSVSVTDVSVAGKDLDATATVTLACAEPVTLELGVLVRQLVKTTAGFAVEFDTVDCDGETSVEMPLRGQRAILKPGSAEIWVTASVYDDDYNIVGRAVLATPTQLTERIKPASLITTRNEDSRIRIGRAVDGELRVLVDCGPTEVELNLDALVGTRNGRLVDEHYTGAHGSCQGPTLFRLPLDGVPHDQRLSVAVHAHAWDNSTQQTAWSDSQEASRRLR